MQNTDLLKINKVHFTGIKGVGMTALACIGKDIGWNITGSDTAEKFVTDEVLQRKDIKWSFGFDGDKIDQNLPDLLIYTAAHGGENNPEVVRAKKLSIPFLSQGEALGIITTTKEKRIAIAGVGGKTTTTALLATILEKIGLEPSYMIGAGTIPSVNYCGKYAPSGDVFISEADEYPCSPSDKNPKFYYQDPNILILTNLAFDHPDVYKNEAETLVVFGDLVEKMPKDGTIIANGDSSMVRSLLSNCRNRVIFYGTTSDCDVVISDVVYRLGKTSFDLKYVNKSSSFAINLAGEMNVSNATAAIIASRILMLSDYQIQKGLSKFAGVSRRMEIVGRYKSTVIMDDYAHHPDEIKATLKTLKTMYPKKKNIIIFQPHTYSRTKALFDEFSQSFHDSDVILIADIYASARESQDCTVNSEILVGAINKYSSNALYIKNYGGFLKYSTNKSLANTVLLTMGAGDIFSWHGAIMDQVIKSYNKWI